MLSETTLRDVVFSRPACFVYGVAVCQLSTNSTCLSLASRTISTVTFYGSSFGTFLSSLGGSRRTSISTQPDVKTFRGEREDAQRNSAVKDDVREAESNCCLTTALKPPEKPVSCCGRGCVPCVWDDYWDEMRRYKAMMRATYP